MSAIISACGRYRYRLERTIPFAQCPEGRAIMERMGRLGTTVAFVMVNPSTADAEKDDATIRRCIGFAARLGFKRLLVGNLFAYRATDVRELSAFRPFFAIGPDNDKHLAAILKAADLIIGAWGPTAKIRDLAMRERWKDVVHLVRAAGKPLHCLGTTKDGQPRHPLMLRADAPLELWSDPSRAELEQRKVMVYRGELEEVMSSPPCALDAANDELGLDGASEYLSVLSTIRTARAIFQD